MQVKTGLGYFVDADGNVVAKAELPGGVHSIKDGYAYVEVEDRKALDAIEVYVPPLSDEQQVGILIQQKMRELAIAQLQVEGKLNEKEELIK